MACSEAFIKFLSFVTSPARLYFVLECLSFIHFSSNCTLSPNPAFYQTARNQLHASLRLARLFPILRKRDAGVNSCSILSVCINHPAV
jgi:hypothetical protein